MTNAYKCENHNLDVACLGCISAIIKKYEKLLHFAKQIAKIEPCEYDIHEISVFDAMHLLREIGELSCFDEKYQNEMAKEILKGIIEL